MTNKRKIRRFKRTQNAKRNRESFYKKAENVFRINGGEKAYFEKNKEVCKMYKNQFANTASFFSRAPITDAIDAYLKKQSL